MADQFDLVILGSGSTAFAAALTAQELGKTAVMTEARTVGGTCVNRGCLPSKNLIEAARLLHDARHPRYPGLHPCAMGLDFATLIAQKDDVIHDYRKKKYESLLRGQFDIATGHVQFMDAHTVDVGGRKLSGEKVLIATGSRRIIPDIQGLGEVPYLTSDLLTNDEPMELKDLPTSLLIVGGGYIALELGQMFHRFGTEVTILERSPQLLAHGYEPEVGLAQAEMFAEEGIRVVTDASARRVRQEGRDVVTTAKRRWPCTFAPPSRTSSTSSTSFPRWPRPSSLWPSLGSRTLRNSRAVQSSKGGTRDGYPRRQTRPREP
ncbi:MAG: FAD-dependent oxidoreductase [Candidatus Entotheonellia bacterium]